MAKKGKRCILVSDETFTKLRELAAGMGLRGASNAVKVLAEAARVEEGGTARFLVVLRRGVGIFDVMPWKAYSDSMKRLAEARAEVARLRRALAAARAGSARMVREILGRWPAPKEAREDWARACDAYTDLLALHGLLDLARRFILYGDPRVLRYLSGSEAYYLLGACADYVVFKAGYVVDKGPPMPLKMEFEVQGAGP